MNLDAALALLAREPTAPLDVAELALCLARDEYTGLDVEGYLGELAAMAREVRADLGVNLSTRVAGLCRYLFHVMGFRGNTRDYYDARNSYLNEVLDLRTGIPISLSAVAMAVGARAGLDVVGVGLPGHFVVKAVDAGREVFFDPFHGGRVLTPSDCEQLVQRVTGAPFRAEPANLQALPLASIVLRMLSNLKAIYLNAEDFPRAVRVLERLRQLQPSEPAHRRDLGSCLVRARQPGRAIDHLEAYLAALPQDDDGKAVRQMLTHARGQVARWN
jgi:regulator of sirC expression with transglutaminase-like and TPR domain